MSRTTKIIAGLVLLFAAAGAAYAVNNHYNCDEATACHATEEATDEASVAQAGIGLSTTDAETDKHANCDPADCDPENCDPSECTAEEKAACAEAKKAGECSYAKSASEKKASCEAWKSCTGAKETKEEKSI